MAKQLKLRRGTTTQHSSFTGAEGELTIDTTKDTAVVHDGSQAGGRPLLREDLNNLATGGIATAKIADDAVTADKLANTAVSAGTYTAADITVDAQGRITSASSGAIATAEITDLNVTTGKLAADAVTGAKIADDAIDSEHYTDGSIDTAHIADSQITSAKIADDTIVNADINSSAAIAGSKISPDFGSQNILTSGNIGRDAGDYINFTTDTQMDVYVNGSNEFRFEADGDFHADGDVIAQSTTTASDIRLKENIELVSDALKKVQALNGVSFDWKKTGERSAGVIAQEVIGVLPEAVKEVTPVGGGDSHLTVNYHALTSILIEAIKELKVELDTHKSTCCDGGE